MLGTLLLAFVLQDAPPAPPPAPARPAVRVQPRAEETARKDGPGVTPTERPAPRSGSPEGPAPQPATPPGEEGQAPPAPEQGGGDEAGDAESGEASRSLVRSVRNLVVPRANPLHVSIPSYVVRLRMLGGRRFSGIVVRDTEFHQVVHDGSHHGTEIYESEQPFTLRFVDGLDGQVTLRWNQVEKVEIKAVLDLAGLRAIEEEMFQARIAAHAELEKRLAEEQAARLAAASGNAAAPAEGAVPPPVEPAPPEAAPERTLLAEFPPDQDWTPERKKHLEWRRTVMGVFPDESEQRFLDAYEQWLPLYEEWVAEQERIKKEEEKAEVAAREAAAEAVKKGVLPRE